MHIHSYLSSLAPYISSTSSPWSFLVERIRTIIGSFIRDHFFLPLLRPLPESSRQSIQEEEQFVLRCWHPTEATDPMLDLHQEVKKFFRRTLHKLSISVEDKVLWVFYVCITWNQTSTDNYYQCMQALGQLSTIYNDTMSTYPFLTAYIRQKQQQPNLPALRFFVISQYNTYEDEGGTLVYKPKTFTEVSIIVSRIGAALTEHWQTPIHHLIGHSLGCMTCIGSLRYWAPSTLPKQIVLDRGPSSVMQLSKLFWGGRLLVPLATWTGWNIDFGQELYAFASKTISSIVVISMKDDHIFSHHANLAASHEVQLLTHACKITKLTFALPKQYIHQHALHGIGLQHFSANHLTEKNSRQTFLLAHETLTEALLRNALPSCAKKTTE